jgi:hypothetical protein
MWSSTKIVQWTHFIGCKGTEKKANKQQLRIFFAKI